MRIGQRISSENFMIGLRNNNQCNNKFKISVKWIKKVICLFPLKEKNM